MCGYHHTSKHSKNLNPVLQKQFPGREVNIDCADHIPQERSNLHSGKIADRAREEECQQQNRRGFN